MNSDLYLRVNTTELEAIAMRNAVGVGLDADEWMAHFGLPGCRWVSLMDVRGNGIAFQGAWEFAVVPSIMGSYLCSALVVLLVEALTDPPPELVALATRILVEGHVKIHRLSPHEREYVRKCYAAESITRKGIER